MFRLRKRILAAAITAAMLSGCSGLDALSVLKPDKPAIEVDAQVGRDASKQVVLGPQIKAEGDVEYKSAKTDLSGNFGDSNFTINQSDLKVLGFAALAGLMIGIFFPSPREVRTWFREWRTPIKKGEANG